MAGGWVKSLHCKFTAFDDVVHRPNTKHSIPSCRRSTDVVKSTASLRPTSKPKPPPSPPDSGPTTPAARVPALTELPPGHPSRNVVEIIFHTSWAHKGFTGRIEMILKVQNGPRAVGRFEEYREAVKARAGSGRGCDNREENARCAADGNEVMRFHCLGATSRGGGGGGGGWAYDACGGAWAVHGGKGAAICTFSDGGEAHENGGGGRGRKGMLVCRVVAGRVATRIGFDDRVGFDSVSGDNGELLVFDSRAVLPCFLIIYRL